MKQKLIFGGYTRRLNQGIHEAYFNPEKGQLEDSRLIFKISNPTYLCTNADLTNLSFSHFIKMATKQASSLLDIKRISGLS